MSDERRIREIVREELAATGAGVRSALSDGERELIWETARGLARTPDDFQWAVSEVRETYLDLYREPTSDCDSDPGRPDE